MVWVRNFNQHTQLAYCYAPILHEYLVYLSKVFVFSVSHGWEALFLHKLGLGKWSRLSSGVLPKLKLIDFGNAQSSTNKAPAAAQLQLLRWHENRRLIGNIQALNQD